MIFLRIKKISNTRDKKFFEKGQASRVLLVLAVVVLVAGIISYFILKMAEKPAPTPIEEPTVPLPVYDTTLGNIRFIFMSAIDRGNILRTKDIVNKEYYSSWQKDYTTTERFIEVTIGAQNKGKVTIPQNAWDIGNIVDSEGRVFEPVESYNINPWLPKDNYCGALLKPEFEPVSCTKIYEVSKISTGLKIQVKTGKNNDPNKFSGKDFEEAYLDLIVK